MEIIFKIAFFIILLFLILLFTEIIELNIFGLQKNTKKNICNSSASETNICDLNLRVMNENENENDNDNDNNNDHDNNIDNNRTSKEENNIEGRITLLGQD